MTLLVILLTVLVTVLLAHQYRTSKKLRDRDEQLGRLCLELVQDRRWMGHDATVEALTERYLSVAERGWQYRPVEDQAGLRRRLNLEPK